MTNKDSQKKERKKQNKTNDLYSFERWERKQQPKWVVPAKSLWQISNLTENKTKNARNIEMKCFYNNHVKMGNKRVFRNFCVKLQYWCNHWNINFPRRWQGNEKCIQIQVFIVQVPWRNRIAFWLKKKLYFIEISMLCNSVFILLFYKIAFAEWTTKKTPTALMS